MAIVSCVKMAIVFLRLCSTLECCRSSKDTKGEHRASSSDEIKAKTNVNLFTRLNTNVSDTKANVNYRGGIEMNIFGQTNSENPNEFPFHGKNVINNHHKRVRETNYLLPRASLRASVNVSSNDDNTEYLYPPIIPQPPKLHVPHFFSEDLVSDPPSSSLTNGNPSHQDNDLANPRSGWIHTGQSSWRPFSGRRWRPRRAIGLGRQGNLSTMEHEDESARLSAGRASGRRLQMRRKYDKTSFAGSQRNPCDRLLNGTCFSKKVQRYPRARDPLRERGENSSKIKRELEREVKRSCKSALQLSNARNQSRSLRRREVSEVFLCAETCEFLCDLLNFLRNFEFSENLTTSRRPRQDVNVRPSYSSNSSDRTQIQSRALRHRHQAETNLGSNSSSLLDREHAPFFDRQDGQFLRRRLRQKRASVPDATIRDDTTKLGNTVGLKGNNSSLKESKIAAIFRGVAYGTPSDSPFLKNDETETSRNELAELDFKGSKQSANAITQAEIIEKMMRGVKKAIIGKEVRNEVSNKESSASYRPEMLKNDATVLKDSVMLSINRPDMMKESKANTDSEIRDNRTKNEITVPTVNLSVGRNIDSRHETRLELDNNYLRANHSVGIIKNILPNTPKITHDVWLEEIDSRDVTILSHESTNTTRISESSEIRKSLGLYLDLLICCSSVSFGVLVIIAVCELSRGRLWHEVSAVWFALFYISIIATSSLRGSCYLFDSYGTKKGIIQDALVLLWNLSTSLMLFALAVFHIVLHKTLKSPSNFLSPILVLTLFSFNIFLRVGIDLSPMVFSVHWLRVKSLKYFQFIPISVSILLILLYIRLLIILERNDTGLLKKLDSFPQPPQRLIKSGRISLISVLCQTVLTTTQVLNLLFPFKLGEGMGVTLVRMRFAGQIIERVAEIILLLSLTLASCSLVQAKQGDCPPSVRTNICSLFARCCAKASGVHPESRKRSPLKIFTLQYKRSSYDYVTNDFQLVWNQSRIGDRSTEDISSFHGVTRARPDPCNLPPMKFLPSVKRGSESVLTPSPEENVHSPLSKSTTGLYDNIQIAQIVRHEPKMMSYDRHRGFYLENYKYLGSTLPHKSNQSHRAHEKFPIDRTLTESNCRVPSPSSSYWSPHSPSSQMQQLRCYRDQYDQSVDSRLEVFQQPNLFARGEEQYFPVERSPQERDHRNWTLEKGGRLAKIGHSWSMKEKTVQLDQRTKSHNHKHEHDEGHSQQQQRQQQEPCLQGCRIMEGNYVRGQESSSACRSLDHLPALALTHQPESLPIQREAVHFSKTNAGQFAEAPGGVKRRLVCEGKISRAFFSTERSRNDRLTVACTARFTNFSGSKEPSLKVANFPSDTFTNSDEKNVEVSEENYKHRLNSLTRAPKNSAMIYAKPRSRRTSQKSPKSTSTFYVNH